MGFEVDIILNDPDLKISCGFLKKSNKQMKSYTVRFLAFQKAPVYEPGKRKHERDVNLYS